MNFPSICIPRIEKRTKIYDIRKIFEKVKFGNICSIEINKSSVFIYFSKWKNEEVRNKLIDGEEINIVYNFPFFWKCRANANIYYLKNVKLQTTLKKREEQIQKLQDKFLSIHSYARYLSNKQ